METIKNISIYMTCVLNLSDIKVTNQVKEQLEELFREGRTLQETNSNIGYEEVWEWLIEQAKNQSRADYFHFNVDWIETEE